ncbi:MAG TPA: ABC transporter ATP-binding protein [Rheinheimera sp.]|nr:ABC transporter ATP-binding protein [Rheinheimera sp.]
MNEAAELVIDTHGMSRQFGDRWVVQDLDLQVPKGAIYGFLGPNGCGKSTSIRMLTGLLTPSRGQVKVLGYDLPAQAEPLRQRIGYMTQKFSLYDNLSLLENLQFVARIYQLPRQRATQRIDELMALYHLSDRASLLAGSLSGGQKQRLALAAATMHEPALLFLDEPTSAVDPENRREFWERLFDLSDAGTTILVSTHYMDEAERCHGLVILDEGRMRAQGSPAQLMAAMPAHVVEIQGPELRQLRTQLLAIADVISAAQLGVTLRVLVHKRVQDPMHALAPWLTATHSASLVRANLEDVFVTCTGAAHAQP